jgi:hypothetical protein
MAQANVCTSTDCQNYCVCEAAVASSDALQSCLTQPDPLPSTVNGWCYIDPAQGLGSSAPLTDCGTTQRMLRFAGDAAPKAGEMYYLAIE